MQALKLLVTASSVAVSPEKAQKNKIKPLIGLFMAVVFWSVPALAPEKNEVGLVFGRFVTPSQTLSPGASLIAPGGTVLPNREITFASHFTHRAECELALGVMNTFS